jgi:3-dehydroquinate synthase
MAVSPAPEDLVVQSHKGPYRARFASGALEAIGELDPATTFVLIDDRVAELYPEALSTVLSWPSTQRIEALESNKSLERCPDYVEHLVGHGIRRGHELVAIGGGIMQDIVCFLAATLLRGVPWRFVPTTLLAQADSCIGSKSSINCREIKNVIGTFTPPQRVDIDVALLDTLDEADVRSGIGEMLKVHAIAGPAEFDQIAADYPRLQQDKAVLKHYIRRSLEFKRRLIELDEFDQGPRNVMNYGHSFGHAIESATHFGIPHGIAITIGMDMANTVAAALGRTTQAQADRMHPTLAANYAGFEDYDIPADAMLAAIAKDKKNSATALRVVLPDDDGNIALTEQIADDEFRAACTAYLAGGRG